MEPKRDMDDPVNIDLELDDALKVLLGVDEDGDEPEQDEQRISSPATT